MILLDTSVLIDYLKGSSTVQTKALDTLIDRSIPFGICYYVYQEVLQGAKNQEEFEKLNDYLSSLHMYQLKYGIKSHERASALNLKCRKSGITIRSTIDLIIAEIAIENGLYLLHNDRDFTSMAKEIDDLKIYDQAKFL